MGPLAPRDRSTGNARPAEALLPAWDDLLVVRIVRYLPGQRSHDRAGGPGDALAKLAALRIGRRMGRQQHLVAEGAQRRIGGQRLLLESVDGGATDASGRDGLGQRLLVHDLA